MITNKELIEAAREYKDTPFKHQGRSSEGLDCVGLIVRAMKDCNYPVTDVTNYSMTPDPDLMLKIISPYLTEKPIKEKRPGDILWMRFKRNPQHVAIVTDKGMIHSYSVIGKVVEHGIDKVWQRRFAKCFQLNGLVYE